MTLWYTLTGTINADTAHALIQWVNGELHGGKATKLTLFLSSTGGDVDSAIRVYSYLKGLPIDVEVIGFGQADSAANIIFLGAPTRKALAGSRFLLHEGTFNIQTPTAALHVHEETLRLLKELLRKSVEIIATETNHKTDEIEKLLREGTIFSTEEAQGYGIVTEIIDKLPASA